MSNPLKSVWRTAWVEPRKTSAGRSFRVRYYDQGGKRQTAGVFVSRSIADEFRTKFEEHLNDPTKPFPTIGTIVNAGGTSGYDWTEKVEEWASTGSLKHSTRLTRRSRLTRFGTMMSILHTGQVTAYVVDNFCRHLRDVDKQSPATIAGYLIVLETFYTWLNLPSPVNKRIRTDWKPYRLYVRARQHFYTETEFTRLLAACDGVGRHCYNEKDEPVVAVNPGEHDALWWKTYLSVLYWLGLRMEEASHLIWFDIDLEAGEAKIQEHKDLPGVFPWKPKSHEIRDLVMPPELVDLLRKMKVRAPKAVPYVFLPEHRYQAILQRGFDEKKDHHLLHSVLQGYKRIRTRAEIIEGCFHDFRRTFVTRWMDEPGVSPKDVQAMAGHKNITTTLNIYTMMREDGAKKKVRAVYQQRQPKSRKDRA